MTKNNSPAASFDEALLTTAAHWFDRLQHEELGPKELAAWQQWIAASPAHRDAFDRLQDLWQRVDEVPMPPLATEKERLADRYTGEIPVERWRERRFNVFSGWKPAAAAAALVLTVLSGIGIWQFGKFSRAPEIAAFETDSAEHREERLADGSTLALGAKTMIWVRFSGEQREVVLERGEAFFEVAQDRQRPFVVRTNGTAITALGTAFNVRSTGSRLLVAVTEGAVSVAPETSLTATRAGVKPAETTRLNAGHRIVIDLATHATDVSRTTSKIATAWRNGRLEYLNEPLKDVVADVNRYSKAHIAIDAPALGDLLVTGTVFENDIDGWLRSIEQFMPIRVDRLSAESVVLRSID